MNFGAYKGLLLILKRVCKINLHHIKERKKTKSFMKHWACVLVFALAACGEQKAEEAEVASVAPHELSKKELCWTGKFIDDRPVFLHYQQDEDIISGELIYLDENRRVSDRVLGIMQADSSYKLHVFDKSANVYSIISGRPKQDKLVGVVSSTENKKEYEISFDSVDTAIVSLDIAGQPNKVAGSYYYQVGDKGYRGFLEVSKSADEGKISFNILSVTSVSKGPSSAAVERDEVTLDGTSFIYDLPGNNGCKFKVKFYRDFAYVKYVEGDCSKQFAENATIEGLYLKRQ